MRLYQLPDRRAAIFVTIALAFAAAQSRAGAAFDCVAAGDATDSRAIVWARVRPEVPPPPGGAVPVALTVEVARDEAFRQIEFSAPARAGSESDYTAKVEAKGLAPGAVHYYRFRTHSDEASRTGRFHTAPGPQERRGVRMAFSGDVHGAWRPFPAMQGVRERDLDFFVFLGDTMYETASGSRGDVPPRLSPAAADPFADPVRALADYRRKYLENIIPVNPGGQAGLCDFFESTGHYTLLDNHELGNREGQSGGARAGTGPLGAGPDATAQPPFINHTEGFRALVRAYADYQPVREILESDPADPRIDGTLRLWFEQRWGRLLTFVNLDDRSYRDVRLRGLGGDDAGPRADDPHRTMLGRAQLEWAKATLARAQREGVVWKIVAVSSPIDENGGDWGDGEDGGKSWIGGYRAERNELLSFLAREHIDNVVFITTDDHLFRVNELFYSNPGATGPRHQDRLLPNAFSIVAGPMGAAGPDLMESHAFDGGSDCPAIAGLPFGLGMTSLSERHLANCIADRQRRRGIHPIGLPPEFPGLRKVWREGRPEGAPPEPVDFFSRDTFNWCVLEVDAASAVLRVELLGLRAYPASTFPEADPAANPVHPILSFEVAPVSGSPARAPSR